MSRAGMPGARVTTSVRGRPWKGAWAMLTGGVGIDFETFTGPFIYALGFAQYLVPLAMLEWYFRCQGRPGSGEQLLFAATLAGLTAFMSVGIFAATMGMWLPRL